MRLIIPKDVFLWLTQNLIITHPAKQQTAQGYFLSYDDIIYFQNGYKIGCILKLLEKQYKLGLKGLAKIRKITVLHQNDNWAIIRKALDKLGIRIENWQIHSISEDPQMIARMTTTLYKDFYLTRSVKRRMLTLAEEEFTLEGFDYSRQASEATTTLQFMCIMLCRHFRIEAQQALGMLINQSSLLARIVIQGTATRLYLLVEQLYQSVLQNVDHFSLLLKSETQNVKFVMNGLRCGLFSGSVEVAQKCINIIKQAELNSWLIKTDKCKSVFLGLQRHPELSQQFFSFMSCLYGNSMIAFLREQFVDGFRKLQDFMSCARELLIFMRSSLYRRQFLESKILQQWLQLVFQALETESADTNSRIITINFLTEILLTEDLLKNLRYAIPLRRIFQNTEIHQGTLCQKLSLCNNIFRLLQHSLEKKHQSNAKLFYSTLCELLSNCKSQQIRQFIIQNIKAFLQKYNKMPLLSFLQCLKTQDIVQPTDVKLFTMFTDRCEQEEVDAIGDVLLTTFQESIERGVFGDILLELIERNYDVSEDLIVKSIKTLLSIYTRFLKAPVSKSKRAVNLSNKKDKSLDKIFYTQNQEQQLIRSQCVSNAIMLLTRLLKLLKPKHLEAARIIVDTSKSELKKKKFTEESLDRFTRVLDNRDKQQTSKPLFFLDTPETSYVSSLRQSMAGTFINKLKQHDLRYSQVQIKQQEQEHQKSRVSSQVQNILNAPMDIVELKTPQNYREKSVEQQSSKSSMGLQEDQNLVLNSSEVENKDKQMGISILPLYTKQQNSQSQDDHQSWQKQQLPSSILEPKQEQKQQLQMSSLYSVPVDLHKQTPPQIQINSILHEDDEENSPLVQSTQQPIFTHEEVALEDLQTHESTYISHVKEVHKMKFEYLMLLVHQQGIDKLNTAYKLQSFFGKQKYDKWVRQLLQIQDLSLSQFQSILILNCLDLYRGNNRMKSIPKVLDYFKEQTRIQKGDIKVFQERSTLQKKVVESREGFKQTKLRSVQYKTQLKCKNIQQKYIICYEIVNQILLEKFNKTSIQQMISVTDTIAAEEIQHQRKKAQHKQTSVQRNSTEVDKQRKDRVSARIKVLQKQVKRRES